MSDLQKIPFEHMDGSEGTLGDFAGDVVLVVNVASKCGLTPQYAGLQDLYTQHKDRGLTVLGFPANNFGNQEPGTNEEIAEFCSVNYSVTFPVMSKISVNGDDQHPLYAGLKAAAPVAATSEGEEPMEGADVHWNFEKFLIDRSGDVVGRFGPGVTPEDPVLVNAITTALG